MKRGNDMYVPVLKWKLGEKKALEMLDSAFLMQIMPLIEIQPCHSLEEVEAAVSKFSEEIEKAWRTPTPFLLDISSIDYDCDDISYDESHPIVRFIDAALSKSKTCIPVITFDNLCLYQNILSSNAVSYFEDGIAIRIYQKDFLGVDFDSIIAQFNRINFNTNKVDLIIDLKTIKEEDIPTLTLALKGIIATIDQASFRNIVIIGSGYPDAFPSVFMGGDRHKTLPRFELRLWEQLNLTLAKRVKSNFIFGDYCCSGAMPLPENVSQMRPSAIIKYTTENSWYISKGIQLIRGGHEQYFELASELVESDVFLGREYSWGDEQIYLCSLKERGSGNPTTWVQIATNHHITLVAQQFSNPDDF